MKSGQPKEKASRTDGYQGLQQGCIYVDMSTRASRVDHHIETTSSHNQGYLDISSQSHGSSPQTDQLSPEKDSSEGCIELGLSSPMNVVSGARLNDI